MSKIAESRARTRTDPSVDGGFSFTPARAADFPMAGQHGAERVVTLLDATRLAASILIEEIGKSAIDVSQLDRTRLTQRVRAIINEHEDAELQALVDVSPVRRLTSARATLEAKAINAVLDGTDWLTAQEVGVRQNSQAANPHAVASRWQKEGKIFSIDRAGQTLYPKYLFDEFGKPFPAVAQILGCFAAYRPFRVASWFESINGMLHGKRPREMLGSAPEIVVAAARDHVMGAVHG